MTNEKKLTPIQSDSMEIIPNIQKVAEFMQFVQWLATPSYNRKIKTQKEFADSIEMNQDTLTDWKKHPKLWELVHKQTSTWIKERIPDVIEGLYNNACSEGKAKDVITFLRLAEVDIKN
jgi:hypothetical protein